MIGVLYFSQTKLLEPKKSVIWKAAGHHLMMIRICLKIYIFSSFSMNIFLLLFSEYQITAVNGMTMRSWWNSHYWRVRWKWMPIQIRKCHFFWEELQKYSLACSRNTILPDIQHWWHADGVVLYCCQNNISEITRQRRM